MSNALDLDKLDELHAKATPGPWHACSANRESMGVCPCVGIVDDGAQGLLSHSLDPMGDPSVTFDKTTREQREAMAANLDFVAEIKTVYPALRAELRRLRAIEAGYAKAVEEAYREGHHQGNLYTPGAHKHMVNGSWETSNAKRALERSGA